MSTKATPSGKTKKGAAGRAATSQTAKREPKGGGPRPGANWSTHPATEPAVTALRRFLADPALAFSTVQAARAQIRVLAELAAPEAVPVLESAAARPELRGTAVWALQKVKAVGAPPAAGSPVAPPARPAAGRAARPDR